MIKEIIYCIVQLMDEIFKVSTDNLFNNSNNEIEREGNE